MKFDNSDIRRRNRVLDEADAFELLKSGEYGVLSMIDTDGKPYAVPVNFAYDGGESIYIHCAPEGHKLSALNANNDVTFVIVGHTHVLSTQFTTEYSSVMLRGKSHLGLDKEERWKALRLILDKYSPADVEIGLKYSEKSFHRTEIIRIDIATISAKAKHVKQP